MSQSSITAVRFGSEAQHVLLKLPSALEAADFVDVDVTLSRFRGAIRPWIERADLEAFARSLRTLYDNLSGSADLLPMEEQLSLHLEGVTAGRIHLEGKAWAESTYGDCLSFELELDQSFLLEPLQTLEAWLKR